MSRHSIASNVVIEIGGIPISLETSDPEFLSVLHDRYSGYIAPSERAPEFSVHVELVSVGTLDSSEDVRVWIEDGQWHLRRGDFSAAWDPRSCRGTIRQVSSPYSIDSVLRIVHTLILARSGGFLLHASSAVRNGKAFLFSGLSGAGKTTIVSLAPPDAVLLTDEASYISKADGGYLAHGTPFAGELGVPGANISAPVAAVYLLEKSSENRMDAVPQAEAVRRLMRNILFFAEDAALVQKVFEAACAFTASVPVYRLSFFPDQRVWELIR